MEDVSYIEKITTYGNMPVAKFGHTATPVAKDKIIIFGGASGNVDTYSITNECFCLDVQENTTGTKLVTFTWRKLQSKFLADNNRFGYHPLLAGRALLLQNRREQDASVWWSHRR